MNPENGFRGFRVKEKKRMIPESDHELRWHRAYLRPWTGRFYYYEQKKDVQEEKE